MGSVDQRELARRTEIIARSTLSPKAQEEIERTIRIVTTSYSYGQFVLGAFTKLHQTLERHHKLGQNEMLIAIAWMAAATGVQEDWEFKSWVNYHLN
jgi:hypothetical protein